MDILTILLIVFVALSSIVPFLYREHRTHGFSWKRSLWVAVNLFLLLVILSHGLFPKWVYMLQTGPYSVESETLVLTDTDRPDPYTADDSPRWLSITLWHPSSGSLGRHSLPLILFSHGSFGVRESNSALCRELASHGYVVCAVGHTHQSFFSMKTWRDVAWMDRDYMHQVLSASDSTPEKRSELAGLFAEWMDIRTADLAFVLDSLLGPTSPEVSKAGEARYLIDPTRVGVMGHSMGGAAALAFGRMRPEIQAVLALEAPFMGDVGGVKDGQLVFRDPAYPVPLLNIYTDSVGTRLGQLPQYAQNAAIAADGCDTTFDLYVRGAGHMSLTDLLYTNPPLCLLFGQDLFFNIRAFSRNFNRTCVDFFDAFLKGQGSFNPEAFEPVGGA